MRSSNNKNISLIFLLGLFFIGLHYSCFAGEAPNQTIQQSMQNLEGIENAEQLGHYLSSYYKNPRPEEIPKLVDTIFLSDKAFFNPFNAAVFMAFLTTIAKDNPEKLKEWFEQIKISDPNELFYIYSAVWDSNTPQSKELLEKIASNGSESLARIAKMVTSHPPEEDILDETLFSGGWIDRAWAAYGANGNQAYLRKILMIASSKNSRDIYADDGLVSMATWSLDSMRQRDEIVDGKVKAMIADDPKLEYRANTDEKLYPTPEDVERNELL